MKKLIDIIDTTNNPNILQKMEWALGRNSYGTLQSYSKYRDFKIIRNEA